MMLIDATVTVSGDVTERLSARSNFGEEEGGQDGQLVWWGDQATGPSNEPIVMHFHQDGSAHLLDPAEDAERLVLGRVTPDRDRVRVQVNSHRRLTKLLPAAPARIPGMARRRARRTTDRHRMAAHRTRPHRPAPRTPAIVADRIRP